MRNILSISISFCIFFTGAFLIDIDGVGAQSTDIFEVRTVIGDDTTPPTTPSSLTATGVSTSQIDLSWGASTDDFILSGYLIWRDDVQIATTTATTYSDVGLTASTSYAYYVVAYDSFLNRSASSSIATGTTLSIPPPTSTTTASSTGTTQGSRIRPHREQITSLQIIPGKESVIIKYTTDGHIRSTVKWGRTGSYELGSLQERASSHTHETKITGLTPGTFYEFSIEGENRLGRYGTLHLGTFRTLPVEDTMPPSNVTNLTAWRENGDIYLTWQNPQDDDFAKVRIVRNPQFYPIDDVDGWILYEGGDESYRDSTRDHESDYEYYAVFTYDHEGNVSSGALVRVYALLGTPPEEVPPNPEENELGVTFTDMRFMQDERVLPLQDNKVFVDGGKRLTVSIPYERFPLHLKAIVVTLTNEQGESFKFLLRADEDMTEYTATLAPFGIDQTFELVLTVMDFKTSQIGYADGTIVSDIHLEEVVGGGLVDLFRPYVMYFWGTLLVILMILLGIRLLVRRV